MKLDSLESRLFEHFDAVLRDRGLRYFEEGRVVLTGFDSPFIQAVVNGERPYDVRLSVVEEGRGVLKGAHCACPAFERLGPCKHLWAVALEFDQLIGLPGALSPRKRRARKAEPPTWQQRLRALCADGWLLERDPWSGIVGPGSELRYTLGSDRPGSGFGCAVLSVRRHRRRKDGSWGVGKDFSLQEEPWERASLEPVDRRILAVLEGGETEERYEVGPSSTYLLGPDLVDVVLPLLAEAGRCYLDREGDGGSDELLRFDAGPPYRFVLDVRRDDARGVSVLEGWFEREAARMPLAEPDLVLEEGVLVAAGELARYDDQGASLALEELRSGAPIEVPRKDEGKLAAQLAQVPGRAVTRLPGIELARDVAPRPMLELEAAEGRGPRTRLACRIAFDYGGAAAEPDDPREALVTADERVARRDLDVERAELRRFLRLGGGYARDPSGIGCPVVEARNVPALVRGLVDAGWSVEAEGRPIRAAQATRLNVGSGVDWFDLHGTVDFGGEEVALPRLLEAVREGSRMITLGDGSLGMLPERWLESWGLLDLAGEVDGERIVFPRSQAWLLDALLAQRDDVAQDEGFARLRERLAAWRDVRPIEEPAGFRGELRGYQREGLGWFGFLRETGLGGCLADDMGLGKTVQVLALLEARRQERGDGAGGERLPTLVVAPKSLVFNWIDEARRFAPALALCDYTGTDRSAEGIEGADLVVTTYGTLRRDVLELKERPFDYLILDEAQAIKNAQSQSAKAARLLRARHRLALSGTPVENHLGELWSLFEFLNPGMLGRARVFRRFLTKRGANDVEEHELATLSRAVRPFVLRRTKKDVLSDLPERTEQTLHCELSRPERRDYDELRDHYRAALLAKADDEGLGRMKIQVLEALLRMRQAACHPGLIDHGRAGEGSAKLNTLIERLAEIADEGNKALVFSQFTRFLGIVRARLDDLGLPYTYLDGRTRKRKERVEEFQSNPDCPLFLISLKAGGHGLNLTAADYVFLLDPWWNPAVEAQAIDRAHRIGRTKPVIAYRLIASDTVEERIVELQDSKRKLAEAVLGGKSSLMKDLTRADLERLFS